MYTRIIFHVYYVYLRLSYLIFVSIYKYLLLSKFVYSIVIIYHIIQIIYGGFYYEDEVAIIIGSMVLVTILVNNISVKVSRYLNDDY